MKNVWLSGLVLLAAVAGPVRSASGQEAKEAARDDRVKFWISFVDKDSGLGKGALPVEPDRLSRRASERRLRRGRRTARPNLDAPVSPRYIRRLESLGIEPIIESRWLNAVSARLTPSQLRAVTRLDFVRSVSPVARSVGTTNTIAGESDRRLTPAASAPPLDYGLSLAQLQTINAVGPMEDGFIGTGVRLGFLDTTTDTLHPALSHLVDSGRVVATRDFTVEDGLPVQSNKHGLMVSSTAMGFDEGELVGPCYGGEYILATTEYDPFEQNQEEDYFVAGMEWLESMGADIVNVSLGYSTFDAGQDSYTYADMDGNTAKTTIVSDIAVGLGVVVVTSAGNAGCSDPDDCWYYILSPADGDSVITAGAVNMSGTRVGFSSRGPTYDGRTKPDVMAPGSSVRLATPNGGYGYASGTSFSSPLTAAVACQILQANPDLDPIEVRTLLRATASQAESPDNDYGWGVINAAEAVRLAMAGDTTAPFLIALDITPDTVDATTGDTAVVVTVWASDTLSGMRQIEVCLADPADAEHCETASAPDSGTVFSGRWDVEIPIPQLSEPGTWRIANLVLQDSVVGVSEYDSTALTTAGYPTAVEVIVAFDLAATVILEGPYSGGGGMTVEPAHESAIPLSQPFGESEFAASPLFYEGSESVVSLPVGVVDWLLLELRVDSSAASKESPLSQAVFLLDDGSIVDTSGAEPKFASPDTLFYYVVVRSRNHGSIMSASPVDFSSGHGAWDFPVAMTSAFTGGPVPMKMLAPGEFAMFACDVNHDGQIIASDFNEWLTATKAAVTGFVQEDCNLDGQVNAADFNLWLANTKAAAGSRIPE